MRGNTVYDHIYLLLWFSQTWSFELHISARNSAFLYDWSNRQFDYRPFVVNWCVNLKLLDDREITAKEG